MKRGPKPIEMPDNFRDYYSEQKNNGVSDPNIALKLFISERTLYRWKQNLEMRVRTDI